MKKFITKHRELCPRAGEKGCILQAYKENELDKKDFNKTKTTTKRQKP